MKFEGSIRTWTLGTLALSVMVCVVLLFAFIVRTSIQTIRQEDPAYVASHPAQGELLLGESGRVWKSERSRLVMLSTNETERILRLRQREFKP